MQNIFLVGIGGAIGAILRYMLYLVSAKFYHHSFPLITLFINLTGCFLMGIIMTLILEKECFNNSLRLLICVGILGGYTTLGGLTYEIIYMFEHNKIILGLFYTTVSITFSILACGLGIYLTRHLH